MKTKEMNGINNVTSTSTSSETFNIIDSQYNITNNEVANHYNIILPRNIDIFKDILNDVNKIPNEDIRKFIISLIISFKRALILNNEINTISNYLTELKMNEIDDGSFLLEWNYNNFRIGFSVEPNIQESSYYIVADDRIDGAYISLSNRLKVDELDLVLQYILQFVLRNT